MRARRSMPRRRWRELSPLVSLRVQLWLQELRRVLATVSRDPADIELHSEAAVLSQRERLRLPVVQCRHCHTTGWLTLKPPQESRVVNSPDKIYGSFFASNPDPFIARVYPRAEPEGQGPDADRRPMAPLLIHSLCGQCGHLGNPRLTQCPHCQSDDVVPVHLASAGRKKQLRGGEGKEITVHDDTCPVCGERGGQLIIGAQTTSIAAHAVERLWSAPLNDHKKLILFSDSVQDAAHRAGYIESKTEGYLMRAGPRQGHGDNGAPERRCPGIRPWRPLAAASWTRPARWPCPRGTSSRASSRRAWSGCATGGSCRPAATCPKGLAAAADAQPSACSGGPSRSWPTARTGAAP